VGGGVAGGGTGGGAVVVPPPASDEEAAGVPLSSLLEPFELDPDPVEGDDEDPASATALGLALEHPVSARSADARNRGASVCNFQLGSSPIAFHAPGIFSFMVEILFLRVEFAAARTPSGALARARELSKQRPRRPHRGIPIARFRRFPSDA